MTLKAQLWKKQPTFSKMLFEHEQDLDEKIWEVSDNTCLLQDEKLKQDLDEKLLLHSVWFVQRN